MAPSIGYDMESPVLLDRKSTRLNSSHLVISYAVFCLKKKISLFISVCSLDQESYMLASCAVISRCAPWPAYAALHTEGGLQSSSTFLSAWRPPCAYLA